jgi:putative glutamine amidotransferase
MAPVIGITCDVADGRYCLGPAYVRAVAEAGGVPVALPCRADLVGRYLDLCHGFLLTGGGDPAMERWGIATHPLATPIDPQRQEFELALLAALDERPQTPVLGICLGMQLMGLHAGGSLEQHLPDSLPTAAEHWGSRMHEVGGDLGGGLVCSHHRQALTAAGNLKVVACAPDGVIEAVTDPQRRFYLGVQWHPERTAEDALGMDILRRLVDRASP